MRAAAGGRTSAAWVVAAALALALRAVAEPAAEEAAAEAAASEDAKPPFVFDVGWDDGPTYQLAQRLPGLADYPWAEPARSVQLEGRIGASLQLDGGALGGDALPDGPRFDVRRARFYARGSAYWLLRTEYKVEFAVEDQSVYLNDFFLRWRPRRFVGSVRFGYFDPPVALQALTGSADRSLMETAAPVSAFAPGFRLGGEAAGTVRDPSLTWTFNVSSVGQSQPNAEATSSSVLRAVGRLVWRPLGADVSERLIHLGASASHVISGSGDLQYRARPETFLTPYLVDTGSFDANAALLGLEAAWRRKQVSVQGEYLHALVDADEGGSLAFQGGYLQIALVLTGETQPYDLATAVFQRVDPAAPYRPLRGKWGAFELTGRASYLDLDDGPVAGGRMATFTLGPAWTWNRFVRLHAGYVYAHVSDAPGGSDAHVAQARIELRL